ncbi:MAG TPA: hypothetical protein VEA99_11855 [Gemmatimonadaceae bacterium]|nr:hypothetical protein [Gemmatimonadaceae bacterium]
MVLAFGTAANASAQIIRAPARFETRTWASAGVGLAQTQTFEDYTTSSEWDFGTIVQWRASVDRTLPNGGSVGLTGTLARPTLAYYTSGCDPCDASANLFQVLAAFRLGGGMGFHQVIELHAGVTGFSNFRRDDDDRRLPPTNTVLDPTFAIGYGFGYGLSQNTQIAIVQEYGAILHRREGAPSGTNTLRQLQTTRFAFRIGLGR